MTEIAWCMRTSLSLTQRVQIPLPGLLLSQVEEQVARLPCNRGQGNLRLTPEGGRQWFCARIKLKSEIPAKILFGFEIEPDGVVDNHRRRVKSTRILTPNKH